MEAVKLEGKERQEAMRVALFETFCQQYQSLAAFIQKLPIDPSMKGKVAIFMDTGFLWVKESFVMLEIEAKKALLTEVKTEGEQPAAVPDGALPNE